MPSKTKLRSPDSLDNTLLNNLRQLMHEAGLNEAELSRQTFIPHATLHKIMSGKTEDPRASTLKLLADHFATSMEALLGYSTPAFRNATSTQAIPIISWSECMLRTEHTQKLHSANHIVSEFISQNAFALNAKTSMAPRFPLGAILIINPEIDPKDGNLVIVHYPNTPEATVRELTIDASNYRLLPFNGSGTITGLDEGVRILGVVAKVVFSCL